MKEITFTLLFLLPCYIFTQNLEVQFQNQLDSAYAVHNDAVGVIIHIESPDNNLSWSSSVGYSDTITKSMLEYDQPVLIASNTKPYVAAAILRLVETTNLSIDSPIKRLLKKKVCRQLKKDGYDLNKITVRHLLSHPSGITDYVDDAYFQFVNDNPQHQWTKPAQIQRTIDIGSPLYPPGTAYTYGDINYILLTDIIEKKTKKPFYLAMRELLKLEELGLNQTWFKDLENYPKNTKPLVHQYSKKFGWDSYNLNPSWDLYGGGGIAATIKDATLFFQYLFTGQIIEDQAILKEMYTFVLPKENSNYCLGIQHIKFPTFTAYYHGGFWGTDLAYCPETNSSVMICTLQKAKRGEFAKLSIKMMKEMAK